MKIFTLIIVCFSFYDLGECIFPLIPSAVGGIAAALGFGGYMTICKFKECCTDEYIPADFHSLRDSLRANLYGQHIAEEVVLNAIRSHVVTKNPKKALAMSFHGSPGTGKNYLADFIVKSLYKKGEESRYVHNFRGRLRFRFAEKAEQYKTELHDTIIENLKSCPRSIFIFDEVEKVPKGILDMLVPFLDYHPKINGVDPTQSIFIFLSNTGASQITERMVQMWQNGKTRDEVTLQDFERLVAVAAFNEKGGFHKSDTIDSCLIDHYVPFLPLEKDHVKKCIVDAFRRRSAEPSIDEIEEVLTHPTFGPSPYNLYSTAGCKTLDQKVGSIVQRTLYSRELS